MLSRSAHRWFRLRGHDGSPWDGSWALDLARSSEAANGGAADGYRFTLLPGSRIRWEIPSLAEVVEGPLVGSPMIIRHNGKPSAMMLGVKRNGARVFAYSVFERVSASAAGR